MGTEKSEFQTREVMVASGGHLVQDIYTSFLAPFLPLLIEKHGLTMFLAGVMTVCVRLPSMLNPLLGILADRRNLTLGFVFSPAATAVAMSLVGLAPAYWAVCLLLVAAGTSTAVCHAGGPVLVARASGDRVGRGMALWMAGGETARALGPVAAVAAVGWMGLEGSWPIMALGLITSVLLYGALAGRSTASRLSKGLSAGKDLAEAWQSLKGIVGPLALLVIPRVLVANTLMSYLPTYLVGLGHSLWYGGMALALLEVAGIGGTLLGGMLSDRLGRRVVLVGSFALSPPLLWAMLYLQGWPALAVLAVLGLISFTGAPVTMALVQDYSAGRRGAANGIYMGLNFVIAGVVLLAVGRMVDLWGFDTALTINAALALCGLPVALRLPKKPGA